ncbi:hypothetical protein DL89DRAFT_324583 [Linderina pennispora]|uniref:Histone deacetylase complex subunit SAP30 Sin3 binding domain-containing protein n=1 Tax=Linderina pennispora TaxID=61395 RepID=A0A1Y1W150_9FUNG|nr:uncharacterized protein DL89DRAFT_324583 [Linderina pennispora]ORX67231.1 hypothetical protein DL89DRAFT_324583 [Linderina pennispora]
MSSSAIGSGTSNSSSKGGRTQQVAKYTPFDFNALNIHTLRKYRQAFKLNVKARSSKEELVVAATRHYSGHMVDEVDTIARFLYTVHSSKGTVSPTAQSRAVWGSTLQFAKDGARSGQL